MMPALSPLSDTGPAGCRTAVPPPPHFQAPTSIHDVRIQFGLYLRERGDTAAREAGLRYESKVQAKLQDLFPFYQSSPHVSFMDGRQLRFCIPDGILLDSECITIFEIKSQHMPEAWWQLRRLYSPVLAAWGARPVQVIEVVRSYDPSMPFPEDVELVPNLHEWIGDPAKRPVFGVLEWKL